MSDSRTPKIGETVFFLGGGLLRRGPKKTVRWEEQRQSPGSAETAVVEAVRDAGGVEKIDLRVASGTLFRDVPRGLWRWTT